MSQDIPDPRAAGARGSRARLALSMGVVGSLVLGCCASIPTSGPVHVAEPPTSSTTESAEPEFAAPAPGASPEQIVTDFLAAGQGAAEDYVVLRGALSGCQEVGHDLLGTRPGGRSSELRLGGLGGRGRGRLGHVHGTGRGDRRAAAQHQGADDAHGQRQASARAARTCCPRIGDVLAHDELLPSASSSWGPSGSAGSEPRRSGSGSCSGSSREAGSSPVSSGNRSS